MAATSNGTPRRKRPIQKAKRVINKIVRVLHKKQFQTEVGIQTTEVFLGGSVGQGTAVTGHYDLDLVLFSRSIDFMAASKDGYGDLQEKIKTYLERELAPNYTHRDDTKVAIKFRYTLPETGYLDVDLLLSPHWKDEESYYADLAQIKPPIKRLMFSVSTSKYQTDFIKGHPQRNHVCELIRRAKAWRNVIWGDSEVGKPKSYLISLLVITAYDRVKEKDRKFRWLAGDVGKEMVALVKEIIKADKDLDLVIPGTSDTVATSPLRPPCPRIVDPVNPTNNLYLNGVGQDPYGEEGAGKWRMLNAKISSIDITKTAKWIMEE